MKWNGIMTFKVFVIDNYLMWCVLMVYHVCHMCYLLSLHHMGLALLGDIIISSNTKLLNIYTQYISCLFSNFDIKIWIIIEVVAFSTLNRKVVLNLYKNISCSLKEYYQPKYNSTHGWILFKDYHIIKQCTIFCN